MLSFINARPIFLEDNLDRIAAKEALTDPTELIEAAQAVLALADSGSAEESLVGLEALSHVFEAPERLRAWHEGADGTDFQQRFILAMEAVQGATFRPQVTDLARALAQAASLFSGEQPLPARALESLDRGGERLLAMVDAIATDHSLPRVDDVITDLGDLLSNENEPIEAETVEPLADAPDLIEDAPVAVPVVQATPIAPEPTPVDGDADQAEKEAQDAAAIDLDLADIFFEEANEILEEIDASLTDWRVERDNRIHLENLLRGLHTLKGSARLAGLSAVGDQVHEFESVLIEAQSKEAPADDALLKTTQAAYDDVAAMLQRIRELVDQGEDAAPAEPAAPAPQEETAATEVRAAPEQPTAEQAASVQVDKPAETAAPEPRGSHEMIRVRATLLESLVNLAGEDSILRARVEQGMNDFTVALDEMEMTIERLREQLRRLELETEASVVFREERAEDEAREGFDPLEMDPLLPAATTVARAV